MVAVLLPAARVARGRLQVAMRVATDPDVAVRRRYRQRADARQRALVGDPAPARVEVSEATTAAPAAQTRLRVRDVDEAAGRPGERHASRRLHGRRIAACER